MATFVKFTIDGKECMAAEGTQLVEAAKQNDIYIPTLCNYEGIPPKGSCRICTVNINGRPATACTTKVSEGMEIQNNTEELSGFRKAVVEMLFAEGNHFCPSCEKSGSCELQALAYKYTVLVPAFPYMNPARDIEAWHPKLMKDHNRCIQCKRCIRGITNAEGKSVFAFGKRGHNVMINIDPETSKNINDELAQKAMDICPVGAIIRKEIGFKVSIGKRKYDKQPIGSDIEK
ncbi:MAG TPA: 2Fe-2S iron-sulfur cluster binding domain-containing protein [bacterium]|nr:2Fe-2S iron-sulfur cluster binding domain-containing protein [bacterium]